jgi:hypothetical protein
MSTEPESFGVGGYPTRPSPRPWGSGSVPFTPPFEPTFENPWRNRPRLRANYQGVGEGARVVEKV